MRKITILLIGLFAFLFYSVPGVSACTSGCASWTYKWKCSPNPPYNCWFTGTCNSTFACVSCNSGSYVCNRGCCHYGTPSPGGGGGGGGGVSCAAGTQPITTYTTGVECHEECKFRCSWSECGNLCKEVCGTVQTPTTTCQPVCSSGAPSAVTLNAPGNGADQSVSTVSLLWSGPSSWGTACSGANNQYSVYVDSFNPPTTLRATLPGSTSQTTFTGTRGTTYYWKVVASNGQLSATSPTYSFNLLYDQISGVVYNDPDNLCAQNTPWSGGGVVSAGRYFSAIAGNGTYSVQAPTGPLYNVALALPAGYACSPGCGVCPVRSGVASPSVGVSFYITNNKAAWWQATGAPIYAGALGGGVTVRSLLPTSTSSLILPGSGGTAGALLRATGLVDLGAGTVSSEGWSTKTRYHGKVMDYRYFAAQMGVLPNQAADWLGAGLTQPAYNPDKLFWYNPATANLTTAWNVSSGESYVVFVNGDLNLQNNVTVASGGFLAFIVKGRIIVAPAVTKLQGIYLSTGDFTTQSVYVLNVQNDVPLAVQGSVVTWGNLDLHRNLGGVGNFSPGESFTYRPDLLTNMPKGMQSFTLNWQQVPAGTF